VHTLSTKKKTPVKIKGIQIRTFELDLLAPPWTGSGPVFSWAAFIIRSLIPPRSYNRIMN